jgi:hypothetical protein
MRTFGGMEYFMIPDDQKQKMDPTAMKRAFTDVNKYQKHTDFLMKQTKLQQAETLHF